MIEYQADDRTLTQQKLEAFLKQHAERLVPGSGISRFVGGLFPQAVRPMARRVATDAIIPWMRFRARRFGKLRHLRLNLGCGTLALPGWVNVDLVGMSVDLAWTIARPLPFTGNSVDEICHEHVLEHMLAPLDYALLRERYPVLCPGAVCDVLPDASRYIHSYCDSPHTFFELLARNRKSWSSPSPRLTGGNPQSRTSHYLRL